MKKKVVVIPARYASTRLPGKPLRDIDGKPLIQRVYEKARKAELAGEVLIATDDERIFNTAESFGARVVMTGEAIPSGTDRVFEAVKEVPCDIIVNLQGDEPFIRPDMIDMLFSVVELEGLSMATLASPLTDDRELGDPGTVKVVLDDRGFALYFSRSPIPFVRNDRGVPLLKHIGIYAYSREFLEQFVAMPPGKLEQTESLEQLRALENGYPVKVVVTPYDGFGIDTEDDLLRAEKIVQKEGRKGSERE